MKPSLDLNFPLEAIAALDRLGETQAISTYRSGLSGAKLSRIVRGFARRLQAFGVDRNTTLLISFEDGVQTFIAALAASLLGATWAIYDDGLPFRELRNLRVVSDPKLKVKNYPQTIVDRHWFSGTNTDGPPFPGYGRPTEICAVGQSSGTTGTPKYMLRTAGSLAIEFACFDRRNSIGYLDENSVVSTRFPINSFLGFQQVMVVLLAGGRIKLANPADKIHGELALMSEAGVTHVIASPNQVAALIADTPDLQHRFQSLLVAGAMITPTMVRNWLRVFENILLAYTSRESAGLGFCSLSDPKYARDLAYVLDPSGEAQAVDDAGNVLPRGETGHLRFRRPYMVTSYIGAPTQSAEVFRDGWFYPGDLGHVDGDGHLHITGRLHDQINLGGIKFNASAVDAAATSVEGVEAAMCFTTERSDGLSELRLCLCLHPDASLSQVEKAVRGVVRTTVRADIAAIYAVPAIPANENGKPLRHFGEKLTTGLQPA